jgi:hypothetical protein
MSGIYATRVSSTGGVLGPAELPLAEASYPLRYLSSPAVGFDGRNYFVVWTESEPFVSRTVVGVRVTPDGTILDASRIPIVSGESPAIAFDGTNYLVAWEDNRAATTDIYAARVTRSGRVLDPRGVLLSTQPPLPARCVVPRLIGMRLARAKSRIRRARCSVGRVRRARSRNVGKVIGQSPRAGSVRRSGYRVSLRVGRR